MTEESTEAAEKEDEEPKGEQEESSEDEEPKGEQDESSEDEDEDEKDEAQKAQEKEEEREQAREKVKELEEGDPPADLEDWPDDAAKYETFGGPEGEHGYHEGPEEEKLGPSSLRHREDGSVTVAGEEVDDPDQYKGEPIPGGPTDPDASQDLTSKKIREEQGRDLDQGGDEESDDDDSDDSDEGSDDDSSEPKASDDGDAESKSDDD
jgi:hypothetical protein